VLLAALKSDPRPVGRLQLALLLALGAALTVAALVGVTLAAGWHSVLHGLFHPRWSWIVVAPAGVAVSHVGYTLAYREVARSDDGPQLTGRRAAAMVISGFGPFSLRGGIAFDASGFSEAGVERKEAALRVLVLGIVEYAVLAPAAFAAAVYLIAIHWRTQSGLLPSWVIGVPAGAVFTLTLLYIYERTEGRHPHWAPLRHFLDAVQRTLSMLNTWPQGPLIFLGMAIYLAGDIAALAACLAIFNRDSHWSLPEIMVGFATGYALTRRTLPLGGAGVVEALLPFALNWVGIPLRNGLLAVVGYRLFNLWIAAVAGLLGLVSLKQSHYAAGSDHRRKVTPSFSKPISDKANTDN
jgi:uncharacterized membrane protein YbhN (UPF0104 family)